ncbi:BH2942 [Halalkalibacterium halodurans C-125]|uniref:BH2942 protein n=1 Tax=Halalkalibacterium halodurans (strain ATCC BAA-125 / DSM 18197 / FERM 7344 / JCM 9153 / C-125) TaxID=272558 RepID=Q9K8R1_HALH5|nr:BH2942 [Halalkalibacterium halodurans C-125]
MKKLNENEKKPSLFLSFGYVLGKERSTRGDKKENLHLFLKMKLIIQNWADT